MKVQFYLYKQKKILNLGAKNDLSRGKWRFTAFYLVCRLRALWLREGQVPLKKDSSMLLNVYTMNLLLSISPEICSHVHWEKGISVIS